MLHSYRCVKLLSWNVNGIRAVLKKGFVDVVKKHQPDVLAVQETKAHPSQVDLDIPGYEQFWNAAEKKGYSGTAVFTRKKPVSVSYDLGVAHHDKEGRVTTLEFPKFYLVNVYTPNAQRGLARLEYRLQWDADFRKFVKKLERKKPVVVCGDLNVAHREIDLANPKANRENPGFSDEERESFSKLLDTGFIDTFRHFNGDPHNYTWWSYMFNARAKNIGWRIDYFCASMALKEHLRAADIHDDVHGSDHCPVSLVLKS